MTSLPLTGELLKKFNNLPAIPQFNPLGDIINQLVASGGMAIGGAVTGGLTGSVLFVGAGPVLAQDNSNVVFDNTTKQLFLGAGTTLHGSNTGLQVSSITANRGASRFNQYGANAGIPGVTGFKSRGATIGSLAKVVAGDVLFRATAIGVADDNASIGLGATISIVVPVGGVPVGNNWVATDYVLELQPLAGPINGRKQAFKVDSEGIIYVKESANTMAGVAVLDGIGRAVIPNTRVSATTRFNLTAQDGGSTPTGTPFVFSRIVGTSFTIRSTANAADAGVQVYYQLFEPTTP